MARRRGILNEQDIRDLLTTYEEEDNDDDGIEPPEVDLQDDLPDIQEVEEFVIVEGGDLERVLDDLPPPPR